MKLSRTGWINAGLIAFLAVAATVTAIIIWPRGSAAADAESTQLTSTVQQGSVSSTITASGQLEAVHTATASFDVSGTIKELDVAVGDEVTKGDTLAVLKKADLIAAVDDAQTALTRAQEDYADAVDSLADAQSDLADAEDAEDSDDSTQTGQSQTQTVDSAESAVDQAEDQVTNASDQVDDAQDALADAEDDLASAELTAPLSGVVTAVNATVGDTTGSSSSSGASGGSTGSTTSSSSGVVSIASMKTLAITASIAEADIATVSVGQTATVDFPALDGVTATATVTSIAPVGESSNSVVTYSTVITLDEVPDGIRLGQTADVTITLEASAEDALYVPSAAVTTADDGTATVEVVADDGTTSTVTVTTGIVGDQGTEITDGLEAGETVVIGTAAATTDTSTTEQGGMGGGDFGGGTFPGGGTGGGGFPGGGQGGVTP